MRPSRRVVFLCGLAATWAVLPWHVRAESRGERVRVYVEDDESPTDSAALQIRKHLRTHEAVLLVDEPRDADVRVYVLSSGQIGQRGVVVGAGSGVRSHLDPLPAVASAGAEVVDTREFVVWVRLVAGDLNEEIRNGRRATKLSNATKGLAKDIEGWIRKHRAAISSGSRASAP